MARLDRLTDLKRRSFSSVQAAVALFYRLGIDRWDLEHPRYSEDNSAFNTPNAV